MTDRLFVELGIVVILGAILCVAWLMQRNHTKTHDKIDHLTEMAKSAYSDEKSSLKSLRLNFFKHVREWFENFGADK